MELVDDAYVKLCHEHEEILARRDELKEKRLAIDQKRKASRKKSKLDQIHAAQRNEEVLLAINELTAKIDSALAEDEDCNKKLNSLRDNYWAMVRNVKPVWEAEMKEYGIRKAAKNTIRKNLAKMDK